jgi:hypothetical protein
MSIITVTRIERVHTHPQKKLVITKINDSDSFHEQLSQATRETAGHTLCKGGR